MLGKLHCWESLCSYAMLAEQCTVLKICVRGQGCHARAVKLMKFWRYSDVVVSCLQVMLVISCNVTVVCCCARLEQTMCCWSLAMISHMVCMCCTSRGSGICFVSLRSQLVASCHVLLASSLQALHFTISARSTRTSSGRVSSYAKMALQTELVFSIRSDFLYQGRQALPRRRIRV